MGADLRGQPEDRKGEDSVKQIRKQRQRQTSRGAQARYAQRQKDKAAQLERAAEVSMVLVVPGLCGGAGCVLRCRATGFGWVLGRQCSA